MLYRLHSPKFPTSRALFVISKLFDRRRITISLRPKHQFIPQISNTDTQPSKWAYVLFPLALLRRYSIVISSRLKRHKQAANIRNKKKVLSKPVPKSATKDLGAHEVKVSLYL